MPIGLTVTATTTTSATFGFATLGASGTVELQISSRADFKFCVAPTYVGLARATPYTQTGLNQRATYYARARTRLTGGLAEPWSNVAGFRTTDGTAQATPSGILLDPALIMIPEPALGMIGGTAIAGYPLENMLVDAPVAHRQTPTFLTPNWVYVFGFDAGAARVDTMALLNTNLPEDTTVSLTQADNADYLTGATSLLTNVAFRASANMPGRNGYHGLFRFTQTTKRYLYCTIRTPTLSTMLHAEHLVFGRALISKNISTDKTETSAPQTTIERRRSGIPDRQFGYAMRKVDFDLSALSETQYETIYGDLFQHVNEPVLVVPNMRANAFLHDRILYGDLSGGRTTMINAPIYSRSFSVESLI